MKIKYKSSIQQFINKDGLIKNTFYTVEHYSDIFTYIKNSVSEEKFNELCSVAEKLHSEMCRENHTDTCSWSSETDRYIGTEHISRWQYYAHINYLVKAYNMNLIGVDVDKFLSIYKIAIGGVK